MRSLFHTIMGKSGGTSPIVTTGLVLNFDVSNPASYPGSGTTITDLSGNGNNGTLINGVGYSATDGGILTFDGVNDYISTSLVTPSTAFSYGLWVKTSTSNNIANRPIGNGDYSGGLSGASMILAYSSNQSYFVRRAGVNNGDRDIFAPSVTNFLGNWHYIVMTYDGTNGMKVYCDNVLLGTNAVLGFTSINTLSVGRDGTGGAFNGSIGATQVYNKALTVGEIDQNFNADKTRFGL